MSQPLWSPSLRPLFYFGVTISVMFPVSYGWAVFPADFIGLYLVAYIVLLVTNAFTASWGLAECAQTYYDGRKLRKQTENYLYDQTSFHSEGGY